MRENKDLKRELEISESVSDQHLADAVKLRAEADELREALAASEAAALRSEWITLTDANYGNEFLIRAEHITAITIVSDTTYREGKIPDGVFRRTVIYTIGGNNVAVREPPSEILAALPRDTPTQAAALEKVIQSAKRDGREEMRELAALSCENGHNSCKVKRTCHDADAITIRNLPLDPEVPR